MPWTPPVGSAALALACDYSPPVGSAALHLVGDESSETRTLTVAALTQTVAALAFVVPVVALTVAGQTAPPTAAITFASLAPVGGATLHLTGEYTPPVGGAALHLVGDESSETRNLIVFCQTQANSEVYFESVCPISMVIEIQTQAHSNINISYQPARLLSYVGGATHYDQKAMSLWRVYRDDDDVLLIYL